MRLSYELSTQSGPSAMELAESLAKPFESCRLKAYWDDAGYPTNGWGNLLSRQTKQDTMKKFGLSSKGADAWLQDTYPPISQEKADHDFSVNLLKFYGSVKRLVKVQLTQYQFAALIDFAFNLGAGNLQASTLLRMVNRREFIDASEQFIRWNRAGGRVMRGLTRRRLAEKALFLRGIS